MLNPKMVAVAATVAAVGFAPASPAMAWSGHHHQCKRHHHKRHVRPTTTTNTATNTATITISRSVLVNSPITVNQAALAGSTVSLP